MPALNLKDKVKNNELDLSNLGLKEVPIQEILQLKQISSINLSNNKLSSIPKGIGNLTQLVKLDLSKNQLKGIPDGIGNLTNLKTLNLNGNQLTSITPSLGNLKSLKFLDLKNNPLSAKFSEIVGPCSNEKLCQQAASNVLKAFSSKDDKKKKQKEADQQSDAGKKKKSTNDKKQKPKGKDRTSKKSTSFFGKVLSFISCLIKYSIISIVTLSLSVYAYSYYDKERFDNIKVAYVIPLWTNVTKEYLGDELSEKVNLFLSKAAESSDNAIVTTGKLVLKTSNDVYVYLTTNENIQNTIQQVKTYVKNTYDRLTGTEQKS